MLIALDLKEKPLIPCDHVINCEFGGDGCSQDALSWGCIPVFKKPKLTVVKTHKNHEASVCCPNKNCKNSDKSMIDSGGGNAPFYTCKKCGTKKAMVCFITPIAPLSPQIYDTLDK